MGSYTPRVVPADVALARAAVALLVRPSPAGPELLVIRRAVRAGDPWSGHMALPGGRPCPTDGSLRETAERETREEVGVDLAAVGRLLGRLDDVEPRSGAPSVAVAAFVFLVPEHTETRTNEEVDLAIWTPIEELAAPAAAREYLHPLESGARATFPAIGVQEHLIWGITHRIVSQFLSIVDPGRGREEDAG